MRLSSLALLLLLTFGCKSRQAPPPPPSAATPPTTQPAMPPGHPPIGAVTLKWQAPPTWRAEKPATPMRRAQYVLPGKEKGSDAELLVFHFPGTGGGVQDNLDRWYGQFQQPDGTPSAKRARTEKRTIHGLPVTIAYLTGTYLKTASPMVMTGPRQAIPDQALLAAVVETAAGPWFFKAVGPRKTVEAHRAAFDALLSSLRTER